MARKTAYLLFGAISLLLGVLGVVLPLLPTTPFVLLAAYFFSRSSNRLHQLLLRQAIFGPLIRDWEKFGVVSQRAKWYATGMIVLCAGGSIVFAQPPLIPSIACVLLLLVVLVYLWTRPSERVSWRLNSL